LGQAESDAGLPGAVERLEDALRATGEAPRRAELALSHGRALHYQGRHREAIEVIASALADGIGGALGSDLEAAYVGAALHVPELAAEARAGGERMVAALSGSPTPGQRQALAHLAMHHSLRGAPRASVRELARLAWSDGALTDAVTHGEAGWPLLTGALLFADELELDLEICDAALAEAREGTSPAAQAVASYCRVWPLYEQGRIAETAAVAQAAIDARPEVRETYLRPAYGAIACCHLQRGQLEQAETALSIIDHPSVGESAHLPFLLDVRAQLRLAQLRAGEALEDALEAGHRLGDVAGPGALAWRSTAALAHLSLGDPERARELAGEELELARGSEITRVVIRDLRVLGLAERGDRGLKLLHEAVRTGEGYPQRLEYIHALVDLGGALRRSNHRMAAREPLRKALELSHRGGARALELRARAELTATGARPRREMLSGLASLTPSERRVGELAARGLTTRQIAETLFVTPKTVEFHLRHIYRKLDVSSRAELAEAMGGPDAGA
jgi:DNA-binding CsgD family transcriptional regulator